MMLLLLKNQQKHKKKRYIRQKEDHMILANLDKNKFINGINDQKVINLSDNTTNKLSKFRTKTWQISIIMRAEFISQTTK